MIVVDAGHIPGILHQFYYLFMQKYLPEKNVKEDRFRIRVRAINRLIYIAPFSNNRVPRA
jgi:hypothetical protein